MQGAIHSVGGGVITQLDRPKAMRGQSGVMLQIIRNDECEPSASKPE